VPLKVSRNGRTLELSITSADRRQFLKGPVIH
jgi:hypothetical protein